MSAIGPIAARAIPTVGGIASPTPGATATGTSGIGGFGQLLDGVADSLEQAETLGTQLATGELTDIHQLTAAAAKAQLGTQLTVAFRDKAVEAFQQIMNMPI